MLRNAALLVLLSASLAFGQLTNIKLTTEQQASYQDELHRVTKSFSDIKNKYKDKNNVTQDDLYNVDIIQTFNLCFVHSTYGQFDTAIKTYEQGLKQAAKVKLSPNKMPTAYSVMCRAHAKAYGYLEDYRENTAKKVLNQALDADQRTEATLQLAWHFFVTCPDQITANKDKSGKPTKTTIDMHIDTNPQNSVALIKFIDLGTGMPILLIVSQSDQEFYSDNASAYFIIDGQTIKIHRVYYDSSQGKFEYGSVLEQIFFNLQKDVYTRIIQSKTTKFKLGPHEFSINPSHRVALRALTRKLLPSDE